MVHLDPQRFRDAGDLPGSAVMKSADSLALKLNRQNCGRTFDPLQKLLGEWPYGWCRSWPVV
jgi:hypothetical protein